VTTATKMRRLTMMIHVYIHIHIL